jgi:hypothetical protein
MFLLMKQFPLDVDEDTNDLEALQQAALSQTGLPACPPSSLTPFIHFLRLRMIESKIEHVIYRLNRKSQANPTVIQTFIDQLAAWKDAIPLEYYEQPKGKHGPYSGIDAFVSALSEEILP